MANDVEIRIGAELSEIKAALANLRQDLQRSGREGRRAGTDLSNGWQGVERGISRATQALAGFLSVYSAIRAMRGLVEITDEFASFNAQLKLTTDSQEAFVAAQREVFRIAQETRAPIADVANTYAILQRSTESLRLSQDSLFLALETVNKSIALTPVNAETARASLVQFGQALAGNFQAGAQELNSILEQTPGLARAIAQGLGVATSDLKKMGEEGKLSAELVVNALISVSDRVDRDFRQIPRTVSQAMTQLRNDLVVTLGEADTSGLVAGIDSLRETLTDPAIQEGLLTLAEGLINLTAFLAEAAAGFGHFGKRIGATIASITGNLSPLDEIELKIQDVDRALKKSILTKPKYLFMPPEVLNRLREQLEAERQAILATMGLSDLRTKDSGADIEERTRKLREEAKARLEAARAEAEAAKNAEKIKKAQLDAEEKLQADSTNRQLAEIERLYDRAAISIADYHRERERIELEAIDKAIERERKRAAAGGVDAVKAEAEIELLERRRADVQARAARERQADEERLQRELARVRIENLRNEGQVAEARRLELEDQYRDMLRRLEAEGNEAGLRMVRNLINTEAARAHFDELKAEFDRITERLEAEQQRISNQVLTGAVPAESGQAMQDESRQRAIAELEVLNQRMQELAQTTNDPAIVDGANAATVALQRLGQEGATGTALALQQLRASWVNLQQNMAANVAMAGVDALTGLFTDLVDGSKSASEALKDFARSFVASMAQIAARALATYAVMQLLSAMPGGGAIVAAMSVGVNHGGGMAGTGPRRKVDPLLFLGAPRYHSGGMVGLRPDERPAILQTGEEVLSRDDPRNQANGGGGTRVVNVIDPSVTKDYLESAEGERVILNVISRNGPAVRQSIS